MIDLALDVGQSGVRAVGWSRDGTGRRVVLPGRRYGVDSATALQTTIRSAVAELQLSRIGVVAAGCTGLYGVVDDHTELLGRLHEDYGVRRLVIADDALTAHLGAMPGSGVTVAAGTGIVTLGRGPRGVMRVDGVGALAGDEGSGWWIGRESIIAALRHQDGRPGGSAELLDALRLRFGDPASVAAAVAAASSPAARVAAFARSSADVARSGDAVALTIWRRAARRIADAVVAAARGAGLTDGFDWTITGGLSGGLDLLEPELSDRIGAEFAAATYVAPRGDPLTGVARLFTLENIDDLAPTAREFVQLTEPEEGR